MKWKIMMLTGFLLILTGCSERTALTAADIVVELNNRPLEQFETIAQLPFTVHLDVSETEIETDTYQLSLELTLLNSEEMVREVQVTAVLPDDLREYFVTGEPQLPFSNHFDIEEEMREYFILTPSDDQTIQVQVERPLKQRLTDEDVDEITKQLEKIKLKLTYVTESNDVTVHYVTLSSESIHVGDRVAE